MLGLVVAGPWCHGGGGCSVVVTAPAPSTDWDWPLRGVKHQLIATTQPPPPLRSSGTHFYTSLAQKALLCLDTIYFIVKLRRGSGKDRQGMAVKAKGLKA